MKNKKKVKNVVEQTVEDFVESPVAKVSVASKKLGNLTVGEKVHFRKHVFVGNGASQYSEYAGHVFEVVALQYDNTHVELKCIDNVDLKVKGYVETYDVRRFR